MDHRVVRRGPVNFHLVTAQSDQSGIQLSCLHSMLNRVYVMVRCLSVCASVSLSVPSFSCCTLPQRVCCCGPSRQETSIDCCMASAVHSGNCEQCHTFSWRTKLNADLFYITASLWLPTSVCLVVSGVWCKVLLPARPCWRQPAHLD